MMLNEYVFNMSALLLPDTFQTRRHSLIVLSINRDNFSYSSTIVSLSCLIVGLKCTLLYAYSAPKWHSQPGFKSGMFGNWEPHFWRNEVKLSRTNRVISEQRQTVIGFL